MSDDRGLSVTAGSPTAEELAAVVAVLLGPGAVGRPAPATDRRSAVPPARPVDGPDVHTPRSVRVVLRPGRPSLWARAGRWESVRGQPATGRGEHPGG